MNYEIVTGPACEPLDTEQAKLHSRVDLGDEDSLIDAAVRSARTYAENLINSKLITQQIKITQTGFCGRLQPLPIGPVQSIDLVQYKSPTDGTLTTWDASEYQLIKSVKPAHIAPAYGKTWPTIQSDFDNVEITLTVGFGDKPDDIPGDIIAAVRLLVGHFYENRQDEVAGMTVSKVTLSAERLLSPHILHK